MRISDWSSDVCSSDLAAARQAEPVDQGVTLERLRFRYEITGDTPPWRPVRAFDDGYKVYIQLPQRIDQGEAPPLFVVGTDGGSEQIGRAACRERVCQDV